MTPFIVTSAAPNTLSHPILLLTDLSSYQLYVSGRSKEALFNQPHVQAFVAWIEEGDDSDDDDGEEEDDDEEED